MNYAPDMAMVRRIHTANPVGKANMERMIVRNWDN